MKKVIAFFVLVLAFVTTQAQLSFGPKAGLNIAHLSFDKTDEYKFSSRASFNAGAFANYKLSDMFAAQIEVLYSGEGENGKIISDGAKDNIKISYLNVPVLFQYVSKYGIYAETGPQIGFLLSIKEVTGDDPAESIKQYYKSINFSWDFGVGYKLEKYVPGLGINVRYALGLIAINKSDVNAGSLKSSVFSVGLFYALKLK